MPIQRETLESLVAEGLTERQIAERCGVRQVTVRHWMGRYDLRTQRAELMRSKREGTKTGLWSCPRHPNGDVVFDRAKGRFRCRPCAVDSVRDGRRRLKKDLVDSLGGECQNCGYNKSMWAMHFDHRDSSSKTYDLAKLIEARRRALAFEEIKKCDLLCANCHAEITEQRSREAQRQRSTMTG